MTLPPEGKPSRELRTQLQNRATALHNRLDRAEPMPGEANCPSWATLLEQARPSSAGEPKGDGAGVLTVREALAKAYGPSYAHEVNARGRISGRHIHKIKGKDSGGLAISTWTDQARDLRRLADVIEAVLGPDAPWESSEAEYTRLRDTLIRRVKADSNSTQAPRKLRRVHKVLQAYIRGTRLVQKAVRDQANLAEKPTALVVHRWLTDLKAAWPPLAWFCPRRRSPGTTSERQHEST